METIQEQIRALKTSVKRQRLLNIALLGIIVAGGLIAAARPSGDATFDTITCKGWKVVDGNGTPRVFAGIADGSAILALADKGGKVRISASTLLDGQSSMNWFDKDGQGRIAAGTLSDGQATVKWSDKVGQARIGMSTFADGSSGMAFYDTDGKARIMTSLFADGTAGAVWIDKEGQARISAGVNADATVSLPTRDLHPPKPK